MIETLEQTLAQLEIGSPVSRDALHLFPLTGGHCADEGLMLLGEAIEASVLRVEEIDDSGSVPHVRVVNRGAVPVLVLEGDELIGAKQNRVANTSVLVAAGTELILPVSCVERGRWSRKTGAFAAGNASSHIRLRRINARAVRESLHAGRDAVSNQGAVWAEVDRLAYRHKAPSPTRALQDTRSQLSGRIEAFLDLTKDLPEDTRGVVVVLGSEAVAVEILPGPRSFTRVVGKLLSGYALAALEAEQSGVPAPDTARTFLDSTRRAQSDEHPSAGVGRDIRLQAKGLVGHALVSEEGLMHAAAFAD